MNKWEIEFQNALEEYTRMRNGYIAATIAIKLEDERKEWSFTSNREQIMRRLEKARHALVTANNCIAEGIADEDAIDTIIALEELAQQ
jgi:hypothetical protein